MRIDFNAPFNNGKNIFAEIHFNNGKEKEGLATLTKPSNWPFKADKFAYILHDSDLDENGKPKIPHIHFIFEALEGQSKSNWIKTLADMFSVSKEAIGVQPLGFARGALRYLTHIDYPDKHQYKADLVFASPSSWFLDAMENKPISNPKYSDIVACETREDIYNLVGLKSYQNALKVWKEAKEEETQKNDLERKISVVEDVYGRIYDLIYWTESAQKTLKRELAYAKPTSSLWTCKTYLDYIKGVLDDLVINGEIGKGRK